MMLEMNKRLEDMVARWRGVMGDWDGQTRNTMEHLAQDTQQIRELEAAKNGEGWKNERCGECGECGEM